MSISIASNNPVTEGYSVNATGLQNEQSPQGWLACDWWFTAPQIYAYNGYSTTPLPSSCSRVDLVPIAAPWVSGLPKGVKDSGLIWITYFFHEVMLSIGIEKWMNKHDQKSGQAHDRYELIAFSIIIMAMRIVSVQYMSIPPNLCILLYSTELLYITFRSKTRVTSLHVDCTPGIFKFSSNHPRSRLCKVKISSYIQLKSCQLTWLHRSESITKNLSTSRILQSPNLGNPISTSACQVI